MFGASLFGQRRVTYFLDLTKFKPPEKSELGKVESGSVFSPHEKIPVVPFKLTIEPFKTSSVRLGADEIAYDVILENISKEPFTIPWSPDERDSESDEGYLHAYLSLTLTDREFHNSLLLGNAVYGSSAVKGSLKTLSPGETARIRAKGTLGIFDSTVSKKIMTLLPREFQIRAQYLMTNKRNWLTYDPLISVNSVPLTLNKLYND